MDITYCYLILLIPLVIMTISDFRRREVNLLWLAVFAAGSITVSMRINGLDQMLRNVALNSIMLLYLTLGIVLYLRMRYKRWLSPFKDHLGSGDMVFFASLTPFLGLRAYITLIIVSCIAGFLLGILLRYMSSRKTETIPMISVVSVVLCIYIFYKDFLG